MAVFDPILTPADDQVLPPSIRQDQLMQGLLQVHQRIFENDLNVLILYDFTNTLTEVLPHLAVDFFVTGYRGWLLAETEEDKRELLRNAIALHKTAGTAYAIRLAMSSVGFPNAVVTENPGLRLDGSWQLDGSEYLNGQRLGGFIVSLDEKQGSLSQERVDLVVQLINIWKNARSELLDLRLGNASLFNNLLVLDGTWALDGKQTLDGTKNITPELDTYLARISAAGGIITSLQTDLIRNFLYTGYSNGSSETATVASFISAFEGGAAGIFPLMGDDLATALIPLSGNSLQALVNSGFVEGDYSASAGIQGDGSNYLDVAIDASDIDVADHYLAIAATLSSSGSNEFLISCTIPGYRMLQNSGGSLVGRINGDSAQLVGAMASSSGIYSMNATASNTIRLYEGLTEIDADTRTVRTAISGTISIFGRTISIFGGLTTGSHLIGMVAIANRALTTSERNVLHNAITAYIAARGTL